VAKALADNKQRIEKFLRSSKGKTMITHQFPHPVGVSVLNGHTSSLPASRVLLILIKEPRLPEGYFLLTGFPEI